MIHLMKLELIKNKIWPYIRSALLANLVIMAITGLVLYISFNGGEEENIENFTQLLWVTDILLRATLIILSSVLLSRLTVEEYKDRTVLLLFTYPVSRKKLFLAKLMVVVLFTIIIISALSVIDQGFYFILCKALNLFQDVTFLVLVKQLSVSISGAVICGFISLVPFYFGMRKKSQAATILSSVIIVVFLSNNVEQISSWWRLLIVGGVSVLFTAYTIVTKLNQLETNDI